MIEIDQVTMNGMKNNNYFMGIKEKKPTLHRLAFCAVLLSFILAACVPGSGEPLTLAEDPFYHPSGIFTISYPQGWIVEPDRDEQVVWLIPPAGDALDVSLVMIAEPLPGENETAMSEAAQTLLEAYMIDFLPYTDYEIYNNAELRVARNPALLLDFARPLGESYHVGRMVLVYLPGYLVFLAGFGPREDWDAFLPTFRQMVDGMTFSLQPFPLEGK